MNIGLPRNRPQLLEPNREDSPRPARSGDQKDRFPQKPLLEFVKWLQNTRLRGRTRLTLWLAELFPALRRVPIATSEGGLLYVDLRICAAHQLLTGFEPERLEQRVMRTVVRPGDVVYDIGAHLGVHTVLLSRLVGDMGEVHAFEPQPAVLPNLQRTIDRLDNVTLHSIALSDSPGMARLYVPRDHSMASLADWTDGRAGRTSVSDCTVVRLDNYCEQQQVPPPDFIKCDVEGAELRVFRGAERILGSANAPIILFELNDRASAAFGYTTLDTLRYLQEIPAPGYRIYSLPDREGPFVELQPTRVPFANVLAVPEGRIPRLDTILVGGNRESHGGSTDPASHECLLDGLA